MSVSKASRQVQLPIYSILTSPLQNQASPFDHCLQLLRIVQVVAFGEVLQMPVIVDTHQLAVSQIAHYQFVLSEHNDEGCAPLVKFFYNLSLTLFENFSKDGCTLEEGSFWMGEEVGMSGEPGGQFCCQIINRVRVTMSVKEGEDGEVLPCEYLALGKGQITRSRLSFLRPMVVKIAEVSFCVRVVRSARLFGDLSFLGQEGKTLSLDSNSQSRSM